MTAIANSVAELGIGDYDGQLKIIQYGPSGNPSRAGMRWHVASGMWIMSKPRNTFTYRDAWPLVAQSSTVGVWEYLTHAAGNPGQIGQSSCGWNPIALLHVDSAFAAGLKLQEKIVTTFWTWDPGPALDLATVFFEMDTGDSISTLISVSAGDNLGTIIPATSTRRIVQTTGWVLSAKQSSAKPLFAPHLYTRLVTGPGTQNFVEHLSVQWRWVGDPTP